MNRSRTTLLVLSLLAPMAGCETQAAVFVDDFEADGVGVVPATFRVALTGGGAPAAWVVREADGAPSGRKVVAQTSDDKTNARFPLLLRRGLSSRDVDVSVRFKAITGKVDRAAGIVWRYLDENNYYVVRANALEDNVVLYKVEKGKRSDLLVKGAAASYGVNAKVPSGQWNTLRVLCVDALFKVFLNDAELFAVEDRTFTEPGRVGLWTKADSVTHFDDFTVRPLDRGKN